jgi:uncharacterized membrane protein
MDLEIGFMLVVRWVHTLAAVLWVGGSLLYLFALRPSLRLEGEGVASVSQRIALEFRGLVDTSIIVLVLTGVVLSFDRLSSRFVEVPYGLALGIKVIISLWMFWLAYARRSSGHSFGAVHVSPADSPTQGKLQRLAKTLSGANLLVILGVVVFFLSDFLRLLFEQAIGGN